MKQPDNIKQPGNKRYLHILKQLVGINMVPKGLVVDCACGNGYAANLLKDEDFYIRGYDIDPDKVAQARGRGIDAYQGNLCSLDCNDDIADGFICSETLEHLDHEETIQAVSEIIRVCKKGAVICITVPKNKIICMANNLHKQFLSPGDLITLFRECKFLNSSKYCKSKGRCNQVMVFQNE